MVGLWRAARRNRNRRSGACFLAALVAASALLLGAGASRAAVAGSGGVVINGVLLPPERVWDEYRFEFGVRSIIHSKPTNVVDEQILATVLERVVNSELLAREAARRGYRLSAEEEAALRPAEVANWRGEASFQTFLKMVGVDEAFVLGRARRRLLIERMVVGEAHVGQQATAAAVRDHYDRNMTDYLDPAPARLRYIFAPPGTRDLTDVAKDIHREAESLRTKGDTYEALVSHWSRHESASRGGVVPETAAPPPAFPYLPGALKECRASKVKIDAAGLHMYYRDCRLALPFEVVRDRVVDDYLRRARGVWARDLTSELRASSTLEHRAGAYPALGGGTGASSHQPDKEVY